ncbi:glycosyl transferase, partial [Thioclava sp. BHET1]
MSDTPLSRRLVKLGFQLSHSRATRHHFTTWPGLQIARDGAAVTIRYRGQPIGAEILIGLPPGLAEITVIGSGPSLKGQAVGRLPERSAILLNGAISLADQIQPLAIAIEDERFVWRHR